MANEGTPSWLISRELEQALASAIGRHEVGMVTRWVALVESVDAEGIRGVWPLTADGMTSWDTLGLLSWGLELEKAAVHRTHPEADS